MIQVTIIIATYNASSLLPQALESVLTQRFQNWECLIVDGASTDGTLDIITRYENRDRRFRHISEPDRGIYDAFNKGVREAHGEWIHFLGSDDTLTSDSFCSLLEQAEGTEAEVISGSINTIKADGACDLLKSKSWEGCHQAKLTRRSAILQMGGFDLRYRISADLDLNVRMRVAGLTCEDYDTPPMCNFTLGGQSQKISNFHYILSEYFEIFAKDSAIRHPKLKSLYIVGRMFAANLYHQLRK